MKRLVLILLACLAILLTTGVSSFLASQSVHASGSSSIQMFSGTFPDQNLPQDGVTKVTLVSIPFSISRISKLEATSLMDVQDYANSSLASITCELDLDSISFFSVKTYPDELGNPTYNSVGLTSVTTGIAIGKHTLGVACLAYSPSPGGYLTMHSLGTSVIITG